VSVATVSHPEVGQVRLGRRVPDPTLVHPHLKLRRYFLPGLPDPPATLDLTPPALPSLERMMLNDRLGCCEISWHFGHLRGVWTGNAGTLEITSDAWIEKLYEVIGGYRPGDPATDQGCMTQDVAAYMMRTGQALGYVAVNAADATEVRTAVWLFGAVTFGACLPAEWLTTLKWRKAGPPVPQNGHCFGCPGKYDGSTLTTSTWGTIKGDIDDAAMAEYCTPLPAQGECWAFLGRNWINHVTEKAPNGFDVESLKRHLEALS